MRLPDLRVIALSLLSATTVTAVSLADFAPRSENLTSACETTYCAQISGCERSDFDTHHCTSPCVAGLAAIGDQIKRDCASDRVAHGSLVALFRGSSLLGIRALCPNNVIQVTTVPPSSSAQQTAQTVEQSATQVPPNLPPGSLLYTASVTSSTTPSATATTAVSTSSSTSSSTASRLLIDTVTSVSIIPPSTALAATISSTSTTTKSSITKDSTSTGTSKSDGSGGGSPFDFNGAATHEGVRRPVLGVVLALTLAALCL